MDLASLATFVKVVQTGSFRRAAEALGAQKAQVSRTVSQLERRLGVRLLERTTRALSLTEIGREMFERALGILAARLHRPRRGRLLGRDRDRSSALTAVHVDLVAARRKPRASAAASYSAAIDSPTARAKETTMTRSITTRFASFAIAAVMTLAMLAAVNGLAVSDAPDALLARVTAAQPA